MNASDTPRGEHHGTGFRPLAGAALLDRLRATGRARPVADPTFADELRSYLEDGLAFAGRGAAPTDGPVAVTPDRIDRALTCALHRRDTASAERTFTLPLACGALVGALFRQVVTVGAAVDPVGEALEALSLDDRQVSLVAWIEGLGRADRAELEAEVVRQAHDLADRWPALDPAWLPRTDETVRVALADGDLELTTRVDLAVGRPAGDEASVALVRVASGARRPAHRHDRGADALIETLCRGVPPFVVATYYTRTGELDVDAVTRGLLVDAARRSRAGARVLLGMEPEGGGAGWCATCATVLRPPPAVLDGGGRAREDDAVAPVVGLAHGRAA